jgi:hypothetical protein
MFIKTLEIRKVLLNILNNKDAQTDLQEGF